MRSTTWFPIDPGHSAATARPGGASGGGFRCCSFPACEPHARRDRSRDHLWANRPSRLRGASTRDPEQERGPRRVELGACLVAGRNMVGICPLDERTPQLPRLRDARRRKRGAADHARPIRREPSLVTRRPMDRLHEHGRHPHRASGWKGVASRPGHGRHHRALFRAIRDSALLDRSRTLELLVPSGGVERSARLLPSCKRALRLGLLQRPRRSPSDSGTQRPRCALVTRRPGHRLHAVQRRRRDSVQRKAPPPRTRLQGELVTRRHQDRLRPPRHDLRR